MGAANSRRFAAPACALSFGVIGWEALYHSAFRHISEPSTHVLTDATLAIPAALLAVVFGGRRWWRTAAIFSLLLIPSAFVHQWLHARGAVPVHVHGAAVGLAHPFFDAAIGAPVAFAIAFALTIRRRTFVLLAAALAVGTLPAVSHAAVTPFQVALPIPQVLTDANITLTAAQTPVQILPSGPATAMWTFNGSFPGPTIRRPSGQTTNVTVVNDLPSSAGEITIHHHGSHSASAFDGQPMDHLISNGGSYTYSYGMTEDGKPERGAFQWYHDHRMSVTGRNIWMGLAGMVILDDPAEAAINAALPGGDRDVPLMVVDRHFDDSNQISYAFNGDGNQGDQILVNGAPQPFFNVSDVRYRLRILNASNFRSYDFAMSDGHPMVQVATESGLLPSPVSRTDIRLGPAERAEVIVDFSGELGQNVTLVNNDGFGSGLSTVMQFRVGTAATDPSSIPQTLRAAPVFSDLPILATRVWLLGRNPLNGEWTINGQGFDPNRVDAQPKLGTAERWIFVNTTDVDHIVHIHDVDWEIIARTPTGPTDLGSLFEPGLRESFRVHPNQAVVVESRFTDHTGRFVWHCHMLEHEDFSMMTQFEVVS